MKNYLSHFREPTRSVPLGGKIIYSLLIILIGSLLGIAGKQFDMTTEFFGNLLSEMSIWVFLATIISVYSSSPSRASLNVFLFFASMIPSYYITAEIVKGVYSWTEIKGWSVLLFMASSSILLFDKLRVTDVVLMIITAIVLFKKDATSRKAI